MKNLKTTFFAAIAAVTLIGAGNLNAQESKVGIKGGFNISNFHTTSDDVDDKNLRAGFNGGLFFKASLTDLFAIQPEILYTTKGAKFDYDYGSGLLSPGRGEIDQRFSYLQVPVLGVITLAEVLNIHAGPYFGYMLKADVENNSENNNFDSFEDLDEDDFERFEYGVSVGAAVELEAVKFGARYDYGLSEIGKEQSFSFNGSEQSSDLLKESKNSVFQLFIGLSF